MPTYSNANDFVVNTGSPSFQLKAEDDTIVYKYLKGLPSGVTLSDHEPILQPWKLLEADDDSGLIDVSEWDNIIIYNSSNGVVSISANTDDDNALYFMPSSKEVFSNAQRVFGCLEVLTNAGTGTVYIYGVR
jgi:hypothetical protein